MLDQLAQPHSPGVRADRDVELRRQQQIGDVLVHPGHPGGVDLHHVDRPGLEQLLEDDPVVHGLAGGDLDRVDALADGGVGEDVVRAGRLLDPVGLEVLQLVDPVDRFLLLPALVGVDGDAYVRAHGLAGQAQAAAVVLDAAGHLELDHPEAGLDRLPGQAHELLVAVAQPSGGGGVCGVAVLLQLGDAVGLALLTARQDRCGILRGQGVADVGEVHRADQLLGGHLAQQQPQRLLLTAGADVPQGVHQATAGHVGDALLGAEPAQLRVVDQPAGRITQVVDEFVGVPADEQLPVAVHGGGDQFIAAAAVEDQPVAGFAVVGAHFDIGGGVVGVDVDGVRAVELEGGGEADVGGADGGDLGHE